MSDSRNSMQIRSTRGSFEIKLHGIIADTDERKRRLKEINELVAYFICLSRFKKKNRSGEEVVKNAA